MHPEREGHSCEKMAGLVGTAEQKMAGVGRGVIFQELPNTVIIDIN